jgi:hypothetical protein
VLNKNFKDDDQLQIGSSFPGALLPVGSRFPTFTSFKSVCGSMNNVFQIVCTTDACVIVLLPCYSVAGAAAPAAFKQERRQHTQTHHPRSFTEELCPLQLSCKLDWCEMLGVRQDVPTLASLCRGRQQLRLRCTVAIDPFVMFCQHVEISELQ